ncbi:MAG: hypothetical protein QOJ42_479, partial [Acidobacteriaceae bacterium]|nr:hypothetical protein [Acidobacteriaceae bacterium]
MQALLKIGVTLEMINWLFGVSRM